MYLSGPYITRMPSYSTILAFTLNPVVLAGLNIHVLYINKMVPGLKHALNMFQLVAPLLSYEDRGPNRLSTEHSTCQNQDFDSQLFRQLVSAMGRQMNFKQYLFVFDMQVLYLHKNNEPINLIILDNCNVLDSLGARVSSLLGHRIHYQRSRNQVIPTTVQSWSPRRSVSQRIQVSLKKLSMESRWVERKGTQKNMEF